MLNSIGNILLKEQMFTLSQLNGLSQATWNRIFLFGHVKLKRPSSLQLFDAVCNFFQQLWRNCNDLYFVTWEPNILSLLSIPLSIFVSLLIKASSFASLFINILPSYYRNATGTGRWYSRLWPVVVCRQIK